MRHDRLKPSWPRGGARWSALTWLVASALVAPRVAERREARRFTGDDNKGVFLDDDIV
jgi:hypothetical protein